MFTSQSQEHRRWDCRRTQHAGDTWYVLGTCHSSYVATKMRIWSGVLARALRSQNWSTHSRTNFSLISGKVRLCPDVKVHLCESLSEDRGASLSLRSLGYSLEHLPPHFLSITLTRLWVREDTSWAATSEMWELCEGSVFLRSRRLVLSCWGAGNLCKNTQNHLSWNRCWGATN